MTILERYTGFRKLGFDYFFFFFLVLMIGKGTDFVSNFDPRFFPVSFLMLVVFACVLTNRTKRIPMVISKIVFFIPIVFWISYHYFDDTAFEYYPYFFFLIKIYIGCLVALYYRSRIIEYYAKIVTLLAGISIPFWLIANLIGIDNLAHFAPFNHSLGQGSSFLIYVTLEKYDMASSAEYYSLVRSPGFTWEPGRFASMLVLAMACMIIYKKGKIYWNSKEWLFLTLALFTTQSTTGYIAFISLLGLHYLFGFNISNVRKFGFLAIFTIVVSYVMTLPFMAEKMKHHADQESWTTESSNSANWLNNREQIYTVDRFEGLYLDYLNLQYKPTLGCGLSHYDTYVTQFISEMLTTSNGILSPLSKLGLLLGIPYFIMFFMGSKRLSDNHGYNNKYLLFIICAIFQFSYNFMFDIFILSIAFYSLVKNSEQNV